MGACQWTVTDIDADGTWRLCCERCGIKVSSLNPPERTYSHCSAVGTGPIVDKAPPSFFRKAANFARAALKQAPLFVEAALTGDESKAVRSESEIELIFKICEACPYFDGAACVHKDCGCPVDPDRSFYWSKLAWRSSKCPDNPPRWT